MIPSQTALLRPAASVLARGACLSVTLPKIHAIHLSSAISSYMRRLPNKQPIVLTVVETRQHHTRATEERRTSRAR